MEETSVGLGRRELLAALGLTVLGGLTGVGGARAIGTFADTAAVNPAAQGVTLYGPDGLPLPSFTSSDPGHVEDVGRNGSLGVLLNNVTTRGPGPSVEAVGAEALVTAECKGAFIARFEGSKGPGRTWYTVPCFRLDDGSYGPLTSIRTPGSYALDIGGWSILRAVCTYIDKSPLTVD